MTQEGRVIPVEILGQRYSIRSELEQEYVARLAAYVDEKIRAAAETTPCGHQGWEGSRATKNPRFAVWGGR